MLQRELPVNGVSVLTEQQDIDLEVNSATVVTSCQISDVSSPRSPADCLVPHMLWEGATGNTSHLFVAMAKFASGGGMISLSASTCLRLWEWPEDRIGLGGATQAITVRLRCARVLPFVTLDTDPVEIQSATDPPAFATAALVAQSRGVRSLAVDLLGTLQTATETLIPQYMQPEQIKGPRRKLHGCRRPVMYLQEEG
jgi:hypothetical protein